MFQENAEQARKAKTVQKIANKLQNTECAQFQREWARAPNTQRYNVSSCQLGKNGAHSFHLYGPQSSWYHTFVVVVAFRVDINFMLHIFALVAHHCAFIKLFFFTLCISSLPFHYGRHFFGTVTLHISQPVCISLENLFICTI